MLLNKENNKTNENEIKGESKCMERNLMIIYYTYNTTD